MATPEYTLTATLDDLTGAAAGSASNPAKLRICLCGFGPTLPAIAGTAMLAKVGPVDFYSTGSPISETLWGNDQIEPAGTFYSIEILDGQDNVVQCGAYVLEGAGADLSSLTPITPAPPPPPSSYLRINVSSSTTNISIVGFPQIVVIDLTLAANTTISVSGLTKAQLIQFIIRQDGTGAWTVTWPSNVKNPALVNPAANSVSTQSFIVDYAGNLYPQNGWQ